MSENLYSPFSREELHATVGGTEEEFDEALANLIEKGVINEHHDGGFTFDPLYVELLLSQHRGAEEGEEDVWLG